MSKWVRACMHYARFQCVVKPLNWNLRKVKNVGFVMEWTWYLLWCTEEEKKQSWKWRLTSEKHMKTSAEFQMNEWMNDVFGADICMPYHDSLTNHNKTMLASYDEPFSFYGIYCACVFYFWFLFIQFCYENMSFVYTFSLSHTQTLISIRKQVHNTLHLYKYVHLHIQLCLSLIAPKKWAK